MRRLLQARLELDRERGGWLAAALADQPPGYAPEGWVLPEPTRAAAAGVAAAVRRAIEREDEFL
jgi:hypothetical protein